MGHEYEEKMCDDYEENLCDDDFGERLCDDDSEEEKLDGVNQSPRREVQKSHHQWNFPHHEET